MEECNGLTSLPNGLLSGLISIKELNMDGCDNLEELEQIKKRRANAQADAMFAEIDTDDDGFLTREEVIVYITKQGGTEEQANGTFDQLDTDKDGKVSKAELRAAF